MNRGLILILAFALSGCGIQFKDATQKNRDFPELILGDFKYTSASDTGRREWELRAREAKMFQAKNQVFLYNMAMTFYGNSNNISSFLSANSGYVDKNTQNIYAEGKVKILSDNQAMLETRKVFWDNSRKLFYSEPNELVTLHRGNTVVRGYSMVADAGLKQVTLEQTVGNLK